MSNCSDFRLGDIVTRKAYLDRPGTKWQIEKIGKINITIRCIENGPHEWGRIATRVGAKWIGRASLLQHVLVTARVIENDKEATKVEAADGQVQ